MKVHCRERGAPLRPHMKTMKSAQAARLAIDEDFGGIAVSTLKEAEYFTDHGFADIQLAICLTPDRLPRAASISNRIRRFSFFLDSLEAAEAAASFARVERARFRAWIEIDSGEHRTGIDPDSDALIFIARTLDAAGVIIEGAATHGGHAYSARGAAEIARVAEAEREAVTKAAARLEVAGIGEGGASAGSTPTAVHAASFSGLSEVRAGVYMAGDLFQAGIDSMREEDLAVSVLASVIKIDPGANRFVVDAGGLALSKDRATAAIEGGDAG